MSIVAKLVCRPAVERAVCPVQPHASCLPVRQPLRSLPVPTNKANHLLTSSAHARRLLSSIRQRKSIAESLPGVYCKLNQSPRKLSILHAKKCRATPRCKHACMSSMGGIARRFERVLRSASLQRGGFWRSMRT